MAGRFVYPINRVKSTPPDQFTALDLMRSTLGVGPCEYILDVEGQKENFKGAYTCSVRDRMTEIYDKGLQKAKKAEIEKMLGEGLDFVNHIRGRIEVYIAFGKECGPSSRSRRRATPSARPSSPRSTGSRRRSRSAWASAGIG
jgi:hypothetical protein